MRPVQLGNTVLFMESPEAARYHAPLLVLPGLFQSQVCWRGLSSLLAHRGWEVYLLPRTFEVSADRSGRVESWNAASTAVEQAIDALGKKVILLGADVGASLALANCASQDVLALALYAPTAPATLAARLTKTLGFGGKRKFSNLTGDISPSDRLMKKAFQQQDVAPETAEFLQSLPNAPLSKPSRQPPTIVFKNDETDDLVQPSDSDGFVSTERAKTSPTALAGRWWPSTGWENATNETHRFLILTLSDRVVEFPDEIIND